MAIENNATNTGDHNVVLRKFRAHQLPDDDYAT